MPRRPKLEQQIAKAKGKRPGKKDDTAAKAPARKSPEKSPVDAIFSGLSAGFINVGAHAEWKHANIKTHPSRKMKTLDFGTAREEPSEYERWNAVCSALAEDTLLDETPPEVSNEDVSRYRNRIAQILESDPPKK